MTKSNIRLLVFGFISLLGYIVLGYFTSRNNTLPLFALYFSLFALYLVWCYTSTETNTKHYYIAIGLRLSLLFATPWLSDDIYRFIWDGRLLANGISPFATPPIDYITNQSLPFPGMDISLYSLLNSPEYFTVYPPLSQLVFWVAALLSPHDLFGSILVIRILILIAETGNIFLIAKLLKHYQLPSKNVLLYALNPLVIIELTGNLHFEAFVILFLLLAIYFLLNGKTLLSGINWSIAIGFKLIPFIFLPLIVRRFGIKTQVTLYTTTGIATILWFLPLYDQALFNGMSSSLMLYFQKFEFNASLYYLARAIGYWYKDYNMIAQLGPALAIVTLMGIIVYSLLSAQKQKQLPLAMMWVLLFYLSLATTVHPWYITILIAMCTFTRHRFAILWSLLIFSTYAGYSITGYSEPIGWITFEYLALATFIGWEIYFDHKHSTSPNTANK